MWCDDRGDRDETQSSGLEDNAWPDSATHDLIISTRAPRDGSDVGQEEGNEREGRYAL